MRLLSLFSAFAFLVACSSQPEEEPVPVENEEVPEITLNLPGNDCLCEVQQTTYTFIEKGLNALQAGEYLEALQYFQRYQRIEKTELADVESRIAIAYLSTLPDSPIFDPDAAVDSYAALQDQVPPGLELHGEVILMQQALESFLNSYAQIELLKQSNGSLRVELDKREEAIKRLRDLTLGREPEPAGLLGN